MNYVNVYYSIIKNRLDNPVEGYVERHHIVPKSEGGTDNDDNIVALTAREHYICHLLLAKIYDDHKMYSAVVFMQAAKERWPSRTFKFNSRLYEFFRKEFSKKSKGRKMSDVAKQKLSQNNGSHRQEVRDKISQNRKGKGTGKRNLSDETRQLMSDHNCMHNKDVVDKVRNKIIGRHHTEETKQLLKTKMKEICNTAEAKRKFSEWQKGKPKPSKRKKVYCFNLNHNLIKIYDSVGCAEKDGFDRHKILNAYRKNILYADCYWEYEKKNSGN